MKQLGLLILRITRKVTHVRLNERRYIDYIFLISLPLFLQSRS